MLMHLFFTHEFVLKRHKFKNRRAESDIQLACLCKKRFGMGDFYGKGRRSGKSHRS